jgi:hypothetical protein
MSQLMLRHNEYSQPASKYHTKDTLEPYDNVRKLFA